MFDAAAFTDTVFQIRRDLEHIDTAVRWLAPTAYEQRAGGHTANVMCRACGGKGRLQGGEPCEECVVAVIGDVGEIVVRRHHIAHHLTECAAALEDVWDTVKGMSGRVAKLANLIDRGASHLPGIDPPTVDPREVREALEAKARRVGRGEDLPPMPAVGKYAAQVLTQKIRTQDAIDEARAKREREGDKGGNRWRR